MGRFFQAIWLFMRECVAGSEQASSISQGLSVLLTLGITVAGYQLPAWGSAIGYAVDPFSAGLCAALLIAGIGGLRLARRVVELEEQTAHDFFPDEVPITWRPPATTPNGELIAPVLVFRNRSSRSMRFVVRQGTFRIFDTQTTLKHATPRGSVIRPESKAEYFCPALLIPPSAHHVVGKLWYEVSYTTEPASKWHTLRVCYDILSTVVDAGGGATAMNVEADWETRAISVQA